MENNQISFYKSKYKYIFYYFLDSSDSMWVAVLTVVISFIGALIYWLWTSNLMMTYYIFFIILLTIMIIIVISIDFNEGDGE